jgi:glycine/D-amino acid oxidase-like deaminating enzyme
VAEPGVIVATGHYRNGILLAPVTAELVVDLVEGRSPDLRHFAPERFGAQPIPTAS